MVPGFQLMGLYQIVGESCNLLQVVAYSFIIKILFIKNEHLTFHLGLLIGLFKPNGEFSIVLT